MFDTCYAIIILPIRGGETTPRAIANAQTYNKSVFVAEMDTNNNFRVTRDIVGMRGEVTLEEMLGRIIAVLKKFP